MFEKWRLWSPVMRPNSFDDDMEILSEWCQEGAHRVDALPPASERSDLEMELVRTYCETVASVRSQAISTYGETVYRLITNDFRDFLRIEAVLERTRGRFPCLLPTQAELETDSRLPLKNKAGHELSIGFSLSQWLANPSVGRHIMASMRLPKADSIALLPGYQLNGYVDLGVVKLTKSEKRADLTLCNTKSLNAEDIELVSAMETAVDIVLLDTDTEVGVLRGGPMEHPKYLNKRVFCSGVDLNKLYSGELPYLFYVIRELGMVSKLLRGLWPGDVMSSETQDRGIEKPWIAAVDGHAIGGGCQLLLVCDHVVAESGSFMSIPARSEGFIPGLANLRLPQYVGRRLANRLIYQNGRVSADSSEGKLLVDETARPDDMEKAIEACAARIINMGTAGIISNRRAFRHGAEPLEQFRLYMASFCLEQANCMFGREIIGNLERSWVTRPRGGGQEPLSNMNLNA
ncbi:thioesterase DpgC [Rhizobium sp. BK650]|uniref:enoyl-CoA hydratase/isomerase family protein n=1 Tax=Rhizobium sp. BK650 TaxID=2586990 RepID=UPI00161E4D0B|nr:enoyl-CoA hydratase/isomerase family protein [Rhizobium sp. BK650]MBB3660986.1 thioesterase DpgC [Rhizobium sp. BK650]